MSMNVLLKTSQAKKPRGASGGFKSHPYRPSFGASVD
jgi:hypothetical protein